MEILSIEYLSQVYGVCFFVGFGLYLFVTMIATLFHLVKDILLNSI